MNRDLERELRRFGPVWRRVTESRGLPPMRPPMPPPPPPPGPPMPPPPPRPPWLMPKKRRPCCRQRWR